MKDSARKKKKKDAAGSLNCESPIFSQFCADRKEFVFFFFFVNFFFITVYVLIQQAAVSGQSKVPYIDYRCATFVSGFTVHPWENSFAYTHSQASRSNKHAACVHVTYDTTHVS